MEFEVVGILNTGQNYIYTLKAINDGRFVVAKFKSKMKRWKFGEKVSLTDEQLDKEAYQIEKI
jgi:hypothetical protein